MSAKKSLLELYLELCWIYSSIKWTTPDISYFGNIVLHILNSGINCWSIEYALKIFVYNIYIKFFLITIYVIYSLC